MRLHDIRSHGKKNNFLEQKLLVFIVSRRLGAPGLIWFSVLIDHWQDCGLSEVGVVTAILEDRGKLQ
jgi:hypothetical protein